MKTYRFDSVTRVPADCLFATIADIRHWPAWDAELESTEHDGSLAGGSRFWLKPRGGPRVRMEIVDATAPGRFVDLCHLPLAKMRTSHVFEPVPEGTRLRITIEVWGPLGFLWDRIVARKLADGLAAQAAAFVAHAAARPSTPVQDVMNADRMPPSAWPAGSSPARTG